MDRAILLGELRALLASQPDFTNYSRTSGAHITWLAKADAILGRWSAVERISFRTAVIQLVTPRLRDFHLGTILQVLHNAEADLALDAGSSPQQVFGPGAVYDFLKALRELMSSANTSLFIIDPYLDGDIFDGYLSSIASGVSVRLLAKQYAPALRKSLSAFRSQSSTSVDVRISATIHDRVVFVDGLSCWVMGQSVKDAAKKGTTYLAPLPPDATPLKLAAYEAEWQTAVPL
jgi:hypothetical protein